MRYLKWLVGLLFAVSVGIYIIIFTSIGNKILQPILENKIREQTKLESKLSGFKLTMSDFSIVLELNKNNIISVNGNYSLFSQAFNIAYRVRMKKLDSLQTLTKSSIRGEFNTEGTIKGVMAFMEIDGVSDLAHSDTSYHVELTALSPTSIIAKVKDAKLESLLYIGGQKNYADADIDLNVNFKNITPNQLDGNIVLTSSKGEIDKNLMRKDFNVTIPKTLFSMRLDALFKGESINYKMFFDSNLAKLNSNGKIISDSMNMDLNYGINIIELALLKPITGADIQGVFKLDGEVKGDNKNLSITGKSDFASSDTNFKATLVDFSPATINASIKNLEISEFLYMVKQPHYSDGVFSLNVAISDARAGKLKGVIKSNIENGLLDSNYMTKAYEFKTKMPRTVFKLNTNTILDGNIVDSRVKLDSSIASFDMKKARFNIAESSLVSDYIVKIPSLDKLFFVTDRDLKGTIAINGELKSAKDLDLTIHSQIAGGVMDAKLHNDDFHADLNSLQTLKVLDMLTYPKIFKSDLNAKVNYNLKTKKGKLSGQLVDGLFIKNQMLTLVKRYGKVDLYKEKFSGDIDAKINKENLKLSLDLKSRTASIKTDNTKLNTLTQKIDSKVTVTTNKYPLTVKLKGDINKPSVSVDTKALIESKVGDKAKEEVTKLLNKFFR
ncbi:MAG: hypothetical protein U9P72_10970 [Campylobacterota bacterium]|nr:hypothetical protein [Campylobacterota bacterium]